MDEEEIDFTLVNVAATARFLDVWRFNGAYWPRLFLVECTVFPRDDGLFRKVPDADFPTHFGMSEANKKMNEHFGIPPAVPNEEEESLDSMALRITHAAKHDYAISIPRLDKENIPPPPEPKLKKPKLTRTQATAGEKQKID